MTAWYDDPITHGYITQYQGPGTDTPHYAEDIGTPFHTALTAPTSGTVKVADYQAWGGEIFVQPDDKSLPEWYMYHPDEVDVHVGQHVNAGQQIALSGGENPGYAGAEHPAQPQWSTGPHTHVGWFTKWTNTPDGTQPYGPPPDNLIAAAKGEGTGGMTNSYNVPSSVYNAVHPLAQADNVPDPLWETVVYMESGFDPKAHNPSGAYGLFQLLTPGGQGDNAIVAGYSTNDLYDPKINATFGLPQVAQAWRDLGGSFKADDLSWWEKFAMESGHPGPEVGAASPYTDQVAKTMMDDYNKYTTGGSSDSNNGNNGSTDKSGDALSSIASFLNNIPGETGQLLIRTGVGLVGILLIGAGTFEIVGALKGESGMDVAKGAVKTATGFTPVGKLERLAQKEEKKATKAERPVKAQKRIEKARTRQTEAKKPKEKAKEEVKP